MANWQLYRMNVNVWYCFLFSTGVSCHIFETWKILENTAANISYFSDCVQKFIIGFGFNRLRNNFLCNLEIMEKIDNKSYNCVDNKK